MALGYDEGTALIKIGREEPVASMDSSGKIIWARHNEIQTVNVKSLGADSEDVSKRAFDTHAVLTAVIRHCTAVPTASASFCFIGV